MLLAMVVVVVAAAAVVILVTTVVVSAVAVVIAAGVFPPAHTNQPSTTQRVCDSRHEFFNICESSQSL